MQTHAQSNTNHIILKRGRGIEGIAHWEVALLMLQTLGHCVTAVVVWMARLDVAGGVDLV